MDEDRRPGPPLHPLTTEFGTSPLLGLRILQLLEATHFQHAEGEARYIDVGHVIEYCNAMNFERQVILGWLDNMLKSGLILSYDPGKSSIGDVFRVEISPSGYQHLIWGRTDWAYLESMLEVTPLHDRELHHELSELMKAGFPFALRRAIRLFLLSLIDEDSKYCIVPDHAQYNDQRKLKERLEQQCVELTKPLRSSSSARYGRPFGSVQSWLDDKGFGFITPEGGGQQVFVHFRDVINASGDVLPKGTVLEYDVVDTARPIGRNQIGRLDRLRNMKRLAPSVLPSLTILLKKQDFRG